MHGMDADDKQWEREQDLRTLKKAEELKNDKARLAGAHAEAEKQMDALAKVYDNPSSKDARDKHSGMNPGKPMYGNAGA